MHCSVLVIGDDVVGQLAPFREFECSGKEDEYVKAVDYTAQAISEHKWELRDNPELSFTDYVLNSTPYHNCLEPGQEPTEKHKYGYHLKDGDRIIKVIQRTNPNSQWDSWSPEGPYERKLLFKNGLRGMTALVKDVDFSLDTAKYKEHETAWTLFVAPLSCDIWEANRHSICCRREFYLKRYRDAADYAECNAVFYTHAVVWEGQWLESPLYSFETLTQEQYTEWYRTYYEKFIKPLDPETRISVIDCHM